MTRETKIGLLTGLGMILLIGILLSNYLGGGAGKNEFSPLANAGGSMRDLASRPMSVPGSVPASVPETNTPAPAVAAVGPVASTGTGNASGSAVVNAANALITRVPDGVRNVPAAMATESNSNSNAPVVNPPVTPVPLVPVVAIQPVQQAQPLPLTTEQPEPVARVSNGDPRYTTMAAAAPVAVAPMPTTAPAQETASFVTYTVKKGDSLSAISRKFYHRRSPADLQKLVDANPTVLADTKAKLTVGMKLNVPGATALPTLPSSPVAPAVETPVVQTTDQPAEAPAAPSAHEPKTHGATSYTVRKGDTLARIAKHFLGSASKSAMNKIMKANGLTDPDQIEAGMALQIPGRTKA